ncbi:TBC1 domain family member 31 isoform X3 [Diabrotica virgifera virgifera]|uniref:Rab-GAP TBC domain-containing protein n=1 Tax=Diabrotica virgifera virgifera TaxID=50390 RepID=A0ABM5KHX5_DIAVI|nr:TBC1 domain family member 31 isoform X3 [Diabrotica virgifera virgifera]
MVLKVHHTLINAKLRFIYCCSHHTSDITALADSQGNIFLIDYSNGKFWGLPKFSSSTLIEFSPLNHDHLLIGIEGGDILICNSQSGYMVEKLLGHRYSVFRVSFSKEKLLSASKYEAITWDLESFSKLQVLTLEEDCSLKYVTFVPISGIILACFQDDLIQMWSPNTYETIKQFAPINWKNCLVKSVSFTRDGQIMVVAGHLPTISLFHLESSKLIKMISLNDYLHSIKRAEFITNDLDGGDNKILAILSGQGILYFLNTEEDKILSQLQCDIEINRFVCTPNGTHAICLLSSGEVEIFNIQQYLSPPVEIRVQKVRKKFLINRKRSLAEVQFVKQEIDSILDIKKLKFILKEYGEYPENYRIKIWERLLDLPNNVGSYNNVINHKTIIAFVDLHKKYPLEDKLFLTSLKKLLSNLVTWCPFFANVEYLPVFVFPFVKVFHNKPLACFEVVCTIIVNWCQHWFEYFPLAPINVLAIAENVLLEHDPELLHHLVTLKVNSTVYIWSLLETIFSEVLISTEWLILWDHILTNEISFLLCASVAYNMVQRNVLLTFKTVDDLASFYKKQNPIDVKRLIKVTYCLLKNTSEKFHPRQYFTPFGSIDKREYPQFTQYPTQIVGFENNELKKVDGRFKNLLTELKTLAREDKNDIEDVLTDEQQLEEKRRLKELEKSYSMQMKVKQQIINKELNKLQQMKDTFLQKQMKQPTTMFANNLHRPYLTDEYENLQMNKKFEITEDQQRKLQMAIQFEFINKFIKKIENELNSEDPKSTAKLKEVKTDLLKTSQKRHNKQPELKLLYANKHLEPQVVCKRHGSEDCFCEVFSSKCVRFSESTTGGSID